MSDEKDWTLVYAGGVGGAWLLTVPARGAAPQSSALIFGAARAFLKRDDDLYELQDLALDTFKALGVTLPHGRNLLIAETHAAGVARSYTAPAVWLT